MLQEYPYLFIRNKLINCIQLCIMYITSKNFNFKFILVDNICTDVKFVVVTKPEFAYYMGKGFITQNSNIKNLNCDIYRHSIMLISYSFTVVTGSFQSIHINSSSGSPLNTALISK